MINYITAVDGQIALRNLRSGELFGQSSDVAVLAATISSAGLADTVANSSSMDFASEYGFANNDAAWTLFESACEVAGYTMSADE